MTDDITTMYQDGKRGLAYAMNEAMGQLQRARIEGDRTAAAEAVLQVNDISIRDQNLDRLYASARQQQSVSVPSNKYGLNADEVEIAHGIAGYDRQLSKDDRERLYAEKRQLYREMRADGRYRDDQGKSR